MKFIPRCYAPECSAQVNGRPCKLLGTEKRKEISLCKVHAKQWDFDEEQYALSVLAHIQENKQRDYAEYLDPLYGICSAAVYHLKEMNQKVPDFWGKMLIEIDGMLTKYRTLEAPHLAVVKANNSIGEEK